MSTGLATGLATGLLMMVVSTSRAGAATSVETEADPRWVLPHDPAMARAHSDEYAWRLFVALNRPGDRPAGTAGPDGTPATDGPGVWETWRTTGEVYLPQGADPGPWESLDPHRVLPVQQRFDTRSLADRPHLRHVVAGVMVPVQDPVAVARRLTESRMNRAAFEFIRARGLYSLDGQLRAVQRGGELSFPSGALDIKAQWRPIAEDQRARYHTVVVRLADGSQRLYGLSGLHVASKVLPDWFWATFEHVDNRTLADGDGWRLPSSDRFACPLEPGDCDRVPEGLGLEGTVWQNYRLRGTMTRFVDEAGEPQRLANSSLEAGFQESASCMTCHARSALGVVDGAAQRLEIFQSTAGSASVDASARVGFVGRPSSTWYEPRGAEASSSRFLRMDYVWSLSKAEPTPASRARGRRPVPQKRSVPVLPASVSAPGA